MGELNPLAHEDSVNPLNISIDMSATAGVPQGGDNARGGVPLLGNILLRIVRLYSDKIKSTGYVLDNNRSYSW